MGDVRIIKKLLDFKAVPLYNLGTVGKEVMNMTAKIGRPKSENPKKRKVTVKMTETEFQMLEDVARDNNLSKSEVVLKGIELLKFDK